MLSGSTRRAAAALVLTGALAPGLTARQPGPAQPQRVNADALLSVQFLKRVQDYLELHRKLEATLAPTPQHATPTQVDEHARALARLIALGRSSARQGDIFTRETRNYFRRQLGNALAGPDGPSVRRSIRDDNPGKVQLRINGRYPDGIPVTTMPPGVLAALPKMPDELEYRFIGERLILLDVHAQLVVDYIDDAIPK